MSLDIIKLIRCDGIKCSQSADVPGSARYARHELKKQGWIRVMRGRSVFDFCDWCVKKMKKEKAK